MKKIFAVLSVMLMLVFGNYQAYAQVLCHKSECCGCCPADGSGISPCRCDVGNDSADKHPQSVSAVTVSKVFVRLFFSQVLLHASDINSIKFSLFDYKPFKPDVRHVSLVISSFQIPLRI
jgi:hypothetical protein